MDCKSVGERIKALKQANNITANDLCEKSGVPLDTINNIVYARISNPSIDSLSRIALALDTTLDYIVLGKTQPVPAKAETAKDPESKHHVDIEQFIEILSDAHRREMESHARSKDEIIVELHESRDFWRKMACTLITFLGVLLVCFAVGKIFG